MMDLGDPHRGNRSGVATLFLLKVSENRSLLDTCRPLCTPLIYPFVPWKRKIQLQQIKIQSRDKEQLLNVVQN
jgi:hypothetical protein